MLRTKMGGERERKVEGEEEEGGGERRRGRGEGGEERRRRGGRGRGEGGEPAPILPIGSDSIQAFPPVRMAICLLYIDKPPFCFCAG